MCLSNLVKYVPHREEKETRPRCAAEAAWLSTLFFNAEPGALLKKPLDSARHRPQTHRVMSQTSTL
jgi:hypothetical protein